MTDAADPVTSHAQKGRINLGNNTWAHRVQLATNTIECSTADVHAPAAATAAVVTYAARAGNKHCLGGVAWSYSAAPTGGNLAITDNGATVFTVDITAAGPGFFIFPRPIKQATANTALVITLASGAGTVVGKVNGINHWYEA